MIKKINILILLSIVLLILPCTTLAATSVEYEYDANGNLIQGVGKYYEYNDANKLVRVRHGDESGPVVAEYFYDSNGQRVKKIENGATTYYIGKYFEKQIEGKHPGESSYYFANGQRVARKDPNGKMFYFHADHLGGTNVITDSAGSLVERTKYYPFGEIREGGNERYSYTGKEKDKVTDFYYFEARHYNAGYRHFTQADIIAPNIYDPQSLNRYAYVHNNPLKYIDPTGHKKYEKNPDAVWWNPLTWFRNSEKLETKNTNNNEPPKLADYPGLLTPPPNCPGKSCFSHPLETMELGGFDYGSKGLKGVKYAGGAHWGVDLRASANDKVIAPEDGYLTFAEKTEYGYKMVFKGDSGYEHTFLHLKKIDSELIEATKYGQIPFDQGVVLGYVGPRYDFERKYSTNPHLHYSMSYKGESVDPNDYHNIH